MKRLRAEFTYNMMVFILCTLISGIVSMFILIPLGKLAPGQLARDLVSTTLIPLFFASVIASAVYLTLSLGSESARFAKITYYAAFKKSVIFNFYMLAVWSVWLLLAKNDITRSRYYLIFVTVINVIIISFSLFAIENHSVRNFYKGKRATLVGVVTTEERAEKIIAALKKDWTRKIVGVSLVDVDIPDCELQEGAMRFIDGIPVVADQDHYLQWIRTHAMDEIMMYVDGNHLYKLTEDMLEIESMGARILTGLPMLENYNAKLVELEGEPNAPVINHEVRYLSSIPLLCLTPEQPRIRHQIEKRIVDIIGGIVGCIITLILMIFIGIPIMIESPGPMFFKQDRVGKNGRIFKMYKFRSMYKDAEARKAELMEQNEMDGFMFKMTDDPRITKMGKFIRKTSIDEFPQFINVLKGDMSLVGTRPPTVDEYKQYSSYHKRRLSIKPGVTGLWHVSGRSDITDFEEIVRLDCEYIDTWNIGLDFKIILQTIGVLFSGEGAK